jgi:hypothetical protein
MKVTATKILPTPSGLVFGLVVRWPLGGPVKFAEMVIPWRELSPALLTEICRWYDRETSSQEWDEDDPLF